MLWFSYVLANVNYVVFYTVFRRVFDLFEIGFDSKALIKSYINLAVDEWCVIQRTTEPSRTKQQTLAISLLKLASANVTVKLYCAAMLIDLCRSTEKGK